MSRWGNGEDNNVTSLWGKRFVENVCSYDKKNPQKQTIQLSMQTLMMRTMRCNAFTPVSHINSVSFGPDNLKLILRRA